MGKFVSSLMGGGNKAAERAQQRDRELQRIAQSRAEQTADENAGEAARNYGEGRSVRGRRLLSSLEGGGLASTLSTTLGGV